MNFLTIWRLFLLQFFAHNWKRHRTNDLFRENDKEASRVEMKCLSGYRSLGKSAFMRFSGRFYLFLLFLCAIFHDLWFFWFSGFQILVIFIFSSLYFVIFLEFVRKYIKNTATIRWIAIQPVKSRWRSKTWVTSTDSWVYFLDNLSASTQK